MVSATIPLTLFVPRFFSVLYCPMKITRWADDVIEVTLDKEPKSDFTMTLTDTDGTKHSYSLHKGVNRLFIPRWGVYTASFSYPEIGLSFAFRDAVHGAASFKTGFLRIGLRQSLPMPI